MLQQAHVAVAIGGGDNTYLAGQVAHTLDVRLIPVAAFGGAGRLLWQEMSGRHGPPSNRTMEPDNFSALAAVGLANAAVCQEIDSLPRILVIHGRSPDKDDVAELVRDAGATPVVMQDEFVSGNTISAEFERLALQVDGAVVVVTPDDEGRATRTPDGTGFIDGVPTLRARQNVILEYGWSWCRFGRAGVALLVRGEVELPSDIADVLHHRYVSSPREISDRIDQFVGRFSDSRM